MSDLLLSWSSPLEVQFSWHPLTMVSSSPCCQFGFVVNSQVYIRPATATLVGVTIHCPVRPAPAQLQQ